MENEGFSKNVGNVYARPARPGSHKLKIITGASNRYTSYIIIHKEINLIRIKVKIVQGNLHKMISLFLLFVLENVNLYINT